MTWKAKFVVSALAIVLVAVVAGAVQNSLYVSPAAENESNFFRNLTVQSTLQQLSCRSGKVLSGESGGAEMGYATHEKDFDQYFAIEPSNWLSVMKSLQEDISSQLRRQGAEILDESSDLAEGFKIDYKSGKSLGVVNVEPLKTVDAGTNVLAAGGACKAGLPVRLRFNVREKWFKKGLGGPRPG